MCFEIIRNKKYALYLEYLFFITSGLVLRFTASDLPLQTCHLRFSTTGVALHLALQLH